MIRKGTTVGIKGNCTKYPELAGKVGIVTYVPNCVYDNFGVAISGKKNKLSKYGYFYLPLDQLSEIHTKIMLRQAPMSSPSLRCMPMAMSA